MTIANQRCICLTEQAIGIRPGPNAKTRLEADPGCDFCRGSGRLTITVSYEPPPALIRGSDWIAVLEDSETGPTGAGSTKQQAVEDLLIRLVEASD